jgi:DNA-binding MarR family transcriptional regulator
MSIKQKRSDLEEALGNELRLNALRSVMFHSAVAGRLGIAVTDLSCLNLLAMERRLTPGELAERIGVTRGGAITAMIDRLEVSGYVRRVRDDQDRRRVYVELVSEVAFAAIAPLFAPLGATMADHLSSLTTEELASFLRFCEKNNELVLAATSELRNGLRRRWPDDKESGSSGSAGRYDGG